MNVSVEHSGASTRIHSINSQRFSCRSKRTIAFVSAVENDMRGFLNAAAIHYLAFNFYCCLTLSPTERRIRTPPVNITISVQHVCFSFLILFAAFRCRRSVLRLALFAVRFEIQNSVLHSTHIQWRTRAHNLIAASVTILINNDALTLSSIWSANDGESVEENTRIRIIIVVRCSWTVI